MSNLSISSSQSSGGIDFTGIADRALNGIRPDRQEARAILSSADNQLLQVLDAAFKVRFKHFGRDVNIHVLQNAKSGICPEDCGFCSQSVHHNSEVPQYAMQSVEQLVEAARDAHQMQAARYCMVTATRKPSKRDLETVCEATRRIKAEMPLQICASLGLLTDAQAEQLASAGVDRFNHNLETSRRHFPNVVTTHKWEERVETIRRAKAAGLEACCGGIIGMGETNEDRIDMAFELAELGVDSIPLNFLNPRPGTPLSDAPRLNPGECLRTLALFRLVNPDKDIRVAGGREVNLRQLQAFALYPANSLFSQGYLTTGGQGFEADKQMIEDAGFQVAQIFPA